MRNTLNIRSRKLQRKAQTVFLLLVLLIGFSSCVCGKVARNKEVKNTYAASHVKYKF